MASGFSLGPCAHSNLGNCMVTILLCDCSRQNENPRGVYIPMPGTCEYVSFLGEGFCRCDQVKDFEMEDYSLLCGWAQGSHKSLYKRKRKTEGSKSERERERLEDVTCWLWGRWVDPGAQEWRWPPEKLENVGQQVVPQPHEGRQPCQHPDFRQDLFWTSKLQNCEIKKLCCFQPRSLW